jgi:hypothetical protein
MQASQIVTRASFNNVREMYDALQERVALKSDLLAPTPRVSVNSGDSHNGLFFKIGDQHIPYQTDHALQQIATWCAKDFGRYARMLREEKKFDLLAENINYWFHDDRWTVRGRERVRAPNVRMFRMLGDTMRAFLSDSYLRVDNEHVAQACITVLRELDTACISVQRCDITETGMYLRVVRKDVTAEPRVGDVVQAGVIVRTDEAGKSSVIVEPFFFRLICLNGMVTSVGGMRRRHVGHKVHEMDDGLVRLRTVTQETSTRAVLMTVQDTLRHILSEAGLRQRLAVLEEAGEDTRVIEMQDGVKKLGEAIGLTHEEVTRVEGLLITDQTCDRTRWGVANAITSLARDDRLTIERRSELESIGGDVIQLPERDWTRVLEKAA